MKPLDIYLAPFLSEDTEVYIVGQFLDGVDADNDGLDKQTRVKVRTHFSPYIDGTRHASLRSVWFDGHPVMITKSGGRPDSEYSHRYITDLPRYREMVGYLKSLEELEEWRVEEELFSPEDEVEGLDEVYTYRVEVSDFGAIAHARQWFCKFLREWGSDHAWPHPPSFPWWKWDDPATHRQPTLEERQKVRWGRILEEAERLVDADPASEPIRAYLKSWHKERNIGSDVAIERALEMLEALDG